ncbi:MAG: ABC transporter ATP-binding protein [Actinomycetota bacterium]|nr:ABC transporter ATP-binding protein [Actinomycetota bacterium]
MAEGRGGVAPFSSPVIDATGLQRIYTVGSSTVAALRGVDLVVRKGESAAIMGPSGSGKSTLLGLLGLLDRPTAGRYVIQGTDTSTLDDDELAALRNRAIGFIFQAFNLLPAESAEDNVAAPLLYAGVRRPERQRRALAALETVGSADWRSRRPTELSGGQQQRVAIARALVGDPGLILADEPTGNLDSVSGGEVLDVLDRLRDEGRTIVLITHDPTVASHAGRTLRMSDGGFLGEELCSTEPDGAGA